MRQLLLILVLFAGACREAPPPAPVAQAAPDRDADERSNLLNIARGAAVVSRTAELSLDNSALRAIDGDIRSPWTSPPGDIEQTLVFSFPAPAQLDEFGIKTQPGVFAVREALIETSMDGNQFVPAMMQRFEPKLDMQLVSLKPAITTRYIRISIRPTEGTHFATLTSVQARGRLMSEPSVAPLEGCWTINGQRGQFTDFNGSLARHIGEGFKLDGGRDGAVYRFVWTRGAEWGHAMITLSPDGRRLSAIKWHEEPIPYNYGESWFGERCSGAPPIVTADGGSRIAGVPLKLILRRTGRYPLYGPAPVAAIADVLRITPRIRLVSREFRGASDEENTQRARARLDALRAELQKAGVDLSAIEFEVAGSAKPHQPIENESMRVLYSTVEIHIPDAARSAF